MGREGEAHKKRAACQKAETKATQLGTGIENAKKKQAGGQAGNKTSATDDAASRYEQTQEATSPSMPEIKLTAPEVNTAAAEEARQSASSAPGRGRSRTRPSTRTFHAEDATRLRVPKHPDLNPRSKTT